MLGEIATALKLDYLVAAVIRRAGQDTFGSKRAGRAAQAALLSTFERDAARFEARAALHRVLGRTRLPAALDLRGRSRRAVERTVGSAAGGTTCSTLARRRARARTGAVARSTRAAALRGHFRLRVVVVSTTDCEREGCDAKPATEVGLHDCLQVAVVVQTRMFKVTRLGS